MMAGRAGEGVGVKEPASLTGQTGEEGEFAPVVGDVGIDRDRIAELNPGRDDVADEFLMLEMAAPVHAEPGDAAAFPGRALATDDAAVRHQMMQGAVVVEIVVPGGDRRMAGPELPRQFPVQLDDDVAGTTDIDVDRTVGDRPVIL